MWALLSILSTFCMYVAKGIVFRFTLRPARAHTPTSAWQIWASFTAGKAGSSRSAALSEHTAARGAELIGVVERTDTSRISPRRASIVPTDQQTPRDDGGDQRTPERTSP